MLMKYHFNVVIDAGETDRLLTEAILNAVLVTASLRHPALRGKEIEVEFVETFDAESNEEIRTHALVQDALEAK